LKLFFQCKIRRDLAAGRMFMWAALMHGEVDVERGFFTYPEDPCSKLGSIIGDIIAAGVIVLIVFAVLPALWR
jgi:hypothetical protein